MVNFDDHFSKIAKVYVKYRPGYPEPLFKYLEGLVENRELALDCATGNGQAAVGLAPYFKKVIAIDPSQAQLDNAFEHPRVEYVKSTAEDFVIAPQAVDLVTVASGIHWFDLDRFYAMARSALQPNGIIAAWVYHGWSSDSALHPLIEDFERNIVGDYWPQKFQKDIRSFYTDILFPFAEIEAPTFESKMSVNESWVIGYLKTWSATQRYLGATDRDPTELIARELKRIFPRPDSQLDLCFKLILRVGKKD